MSLTTWTTDPVPSRGTAPGRSAGADGITDFDDDGFGRRLATLSPTQRRTLHLLARGLQNKQIAYACSNSEATTKAHVTEVLRKTGATSRVEAAVKYALYLERRRIPLHADVLPAL